MNVVREVCIKCKFFVPYGGINYWYKNGELKQVVRWICRRRKEKIELVYTVLDDDAGVPDNCIMKLEHLMENKNG